MGIYVFRPEVLVKVLEDRAQLDFGKEVIPSAFKSQRVQSFFFTGYWEDIGTIRTFYGANMDLTSATPPLDLFNEHAPVYTRPRFLAGSRLESVQLRDALVCDGCRISEATIEHSIIGIRSMIGRGSRISHTVMMGADYYEPPVALQPAAESIPIGVGNGCVIERAIIDKNARIGNDVIIRNAENISHHNGPNYYIRDGIVIVPKNGVIPAGTVV